MGGGLARRAVRCSLAAGLLLAGGRPAQAIEAFDGRIQVHGFVEEQLRVLDGSFNEEADLAQWYNVLTLENEVDIAPNGFGPIDLLQFYARIEARYDCVYSRGCGTMRSVNTYGDRAKRLPQRLRDAKDQDYAGVIETDTEVPRIQNERPSPFGVMRIVPNVPTGDPSFDREWIKANNGTGYNPNQPDTPSNRPFVTIVEERVGFPGFDTLFKTRGADAELGVNQDTGINDDPANYVFENVLDYLWTFRSKKGPDGGTGRTMVMGPWLPKNFIRSLGTFSDRANPFRGVQPPTRNSLENVLTPGGQQSPRGFTPRTTDLPPPLSGPAYPYADPNGDMADPRLVDFFLDPTYGWNQPTNRFPGFLGAEDGRLGQQWGYGGDFSGIIPCQAPEVDAFTNAQQQIRGAAFFPGCFPFQNIRATGGVGELPARPSPDRSYLEEWDPQIAQGLYIPSQALREALLEQDFDSHEFNFRQAERAWNRGQSQQETKEVKEAYIDAEFLDSRLWFRGGLQNIVWGKTELFRTTDQFNPQDLALASLASLEESRIALFAGRFVYSLYDVGPFEDVRAEFAFNFDRYKPADLGACGEAFTPDVVCGITTGLFFHGLTGVGIVGIDRPPNPWESLKGLEIGGRVEWRWDRFSFAVIDFWGYSDFPYPDAINYYERNVDPETGRPRIAGATGSCRTAPVYTFTFFGFQFPISGAAPKQYLGMQGGLGMGADPDCLKAGGAAGGLAENRWDPDDYEALLAWYADPVNNVRPVLYDLPGSSPENALEYHSANQQLFAFICSGTVTIASSVDAGACAWTIWGSPRPLNSLIQIPLSEIFSSIFAGEQDQFEQTLFRAIQSSTKGNSTTFSPLKNVNVDFNDGVITALIPPINAGPIGSNPEDFLTLDSTLTNEQRATLGCGHFYSSRCDSGVGGFWPLGGGTGVSYQGLGFSFGGGFDPLNAEASVVLWAFPGNEGTATVGLNGLTESTPGWTTTDRNLQQPGTIGFEGGPVCTRAVGKELVILPGCRGAQDINYDAGANVWRVTFDPGYNVGQDGCIFAAQLNGRNIVGTYPDGSPVNLTPCATTSRTRVGNLQNPATSVPGARTLFHPLAGCRTEAQAHAPDQATRLCNFRPLEAINPGGRNWDAEFNIDPALRTSQIFRSELAAVSWNMMLFLVITSCDRKERDITGDPECFLPADPWRSDACGFAAPQYCGNVKGFLGVGSPNSNRVEAGGNGRFGRRDFLWHSGGELALRYAKRNVFGFSTDFAEDVTKTNWGVEFTWIGATPYFDNGDYEDGVTDSDSLNLTVSIDRPTFINFLNANRTFFMNTQWFFQYLTNYQSTFTSNGPFNVLFTFAVFTGYYQDRLLPTMVTVYDFGSHSAGLLPSVTYRFNEAFSLTAGINMFFGHSQYKMMPARAFAPTSGRAGKHAYDDGVENVLSAISRRDEVFLRLRYTF
jgi:hypothetical protein